MKNAFTALVLILIIYEVKTQTICEDARGESEDDCRMYPTTIDSTHCCYIPEDDEKPCWELSDDEYENIKRFKDFSKQFYNMGDLTIKCCSIAFFNFNLFFFILSIIFLTLDNWSSS